MPELGQTLVWIMTTDGPESERSHAERSQPRRHPQEISGCPPIGVAEKKRADRLDGFGNSI